MMESGHREDVSMTEKPRVAIVKEEFPISTALLTIASIVVVLMGNSSLTIATRVFSVMDASSP